MPDPNPNSPPDNDKAFTVEHVGRQVRFRGQHTVFTLLAVSWDGKRCFIRNTHDRTHILQPTVDELILIPEETHEPEPNPTP